MTTFGLLRAGGHEVTFARLFAHAERFPHILVVSLVRAVVPLLLSGLGWLGDTTGLLLTVPLAFSEFLILDQRLNAFESMSVSARLVLGNFWQLLLAGLMIGGMMIAGALTLGIAYIWLWPLALIAWGVLYAQAAGLHRFASDEART